MQPLPELDPAAIAATRDALHAYSRVVGNWLKSTRSKRKHWWHASLRPSINGLTTGVVHAATDVEIELDFVGSQIRLRTTEAEHAVGLTGQSAGHIAAELDAMLAGIGIDATLDPGAGSRSDKNFADYSPAHARRLHRAIAWVTAELERFRAGIREETSPIQVWPHHFDLSMIWLPGHKVPGLDPADEENSDKQMNFGFVFGDETISEPYFYVTAYPLPDALPTIELPAGATWKSEGFDGAILLYKELIGSGDPADRLRAVWSTLLAAGQSGLATDQ